MIALLSAYAMAFAGLGSAWGVSSFMMASGAGTPNCTVLKSTTINTPEQGAENSVSNADLFAEYTLSFVTAYYASEGGLVGLIKKSPDVPPTDQPTRVILERWCESSPASTVDYTLLTMVTSLISNGPGAPSE